MTSFGPEKFKIMIAYCALPCYHLVELKRKAVELDMKQHRFWAWMLVFSLVMVMWTGCKHK